jgi:hypothetical protein
VPTSRFAVTLNVRSVKPKIGKHVCEPLCIQILKNPHPLRDSRQTAQAVITVKKANQVPRFWRSILLLTTCNKLHGSVRRVVHHDAETPSDLNFPIVTGSEYSVTEVTLSDNAQEAPIFRGDPKTP